ncbi:MAG: hypothetical protein OEL83_09420 [Desulforhopalus sp.]|nr:hypothetical protein [Desulforhopalus sp.]
MVTSKIAVTAAVPGFFLHVHLGFSAPGKGGKIIDTKPMRLRSQLFSPGPPASAKA